MFSILFVDSMIFFSILNSTLGLAGETIRSTWTLVFSKTNTIYNNDEGNVSSFKGIRHSEFYTTLLVQGNEGYFAWK
ncbi:hypothetical protein M758_6G056000 [Ceratodon purpureus]|nr:hypothetical protein M758_6G056000 [Ceratodon purpureus]